MKTGRRTFAPLVVCAVVFCSCSNDDSASPGSGANGGSNASGGASGSGGSGAMSSGGSGASGGASGSGGSSASGGSIGSSGSGMTGGATGNAGSGASGGSNAVGGASGTDGSGASGGSSGMSGSGQTGGSGGGPARQPYKGVANSPCAARTALNVSWYYNWTQRETEPCAGGGGEFVPMIWGHAGNEQSEAGIRSAVTSLVDRGYDHVLGFNEPDNPGQSNIPVASAISLWPSFDNPAIRIGSPATAANANPGQAWFRDFMTELNADPSLRADFLAIHWYGWNAGSCDANASQLESYIRWVEGFAGDRPIWITEWGCLNQSAPDMATVVNFYNGAIAMFARHTRVERYAWYPWVTNCGLNDSNGSLTALGTAYAAAPAYK